jgi:hypothetical protein
VSLFFFVSIIGRFVTLLPRNHVPEPWNLTYFPPKAALGLLYCTPALYAVVPATVWSASNRRPQERWEHSAENQFAVKSSAMEEAMSFKPKSQRMFSPPRLSARFTLLLCSVAFAQTSVSNGSISGTVTAATGTVAPNAKVAMTGSTGQTVHATARGAGTYCSGALDPGTYSVRAEAKGFKTTQLSVDVQVNNTARQTDVIRLYAHFRFSPCPLVGAQTNEACGRPNAISAVVGARRVLDFRGLIQRISMRGDN